MNLFEDLVTDLQKENLLDDGINASPISNNNIGSPKIETTSNSILKEVSIFYDNSSVKRLNFKVVLPENPSTDQTPLISSDEIISPDSISDDPGFSFSPSPRKKLRKVHIKNKKKGRYCKNCMIAVPYYRFRCRFCSETVVGSLYYFALIFLSIILILGIFFLIIANKTYS